MTKQEKFDAILGIKSSAFDEICTSYDCDLSHRHFHAVVERIIQQSRHVIAGINAAKDESLSLKCIQCGQPATCQVYKGHQSNDPEDFGIPMCELHALEALALGQYQLVEDKPFPAE